MWHHWCCMAGSSSSNLSQCSVANDRLLSTSWPDQSSSWRCDSHTDAAGNSMGVALGFRRLSIIDVDGAQQPLANEDHSVQVVFNGEIYNYSTLRRRLQGSGHLFRTEGDGETIVHLFEEVGEKCFESLNGMFAVAVWDGSRHRLILARDRIGQKPLYYAFKNQQFVFGSELKSLAQVPGVCEKINAKAIDSFLTYQYIPHPETIWEGVHKLPPGHFLIFEKGQISIHRYWNLDLQQQSNINANEAQEQVREILNDSIKLRLQSDVPLGSFLSGGIDSSIITALAQEQSTKPIRTFSIGFPVADFDETSYAAQVASHLGTEHQRFEVQPNGVEILDQLVWHYDEPFGDSSAVPTWYLSKLTRQEVTVALSGDGGDELFAGYERYRALWLSEKLQKIFPIHRLPGNQLIRKLPDSNRRRSLSRRAKRFLEAFGQNTPRRYLNWLQIFPEELRASLYTGDFLGSLPNDDPFDFLEQNWNLSEGRDIVTRASTTDLLTYLPCDLCTKVDIASMANSLEVRQPFLDYRLVEFAASLPVHHKFRGKRGKLILQSCFGNKIPREIFTRSKMGFGIPIAGWFRNELKELMQDTLLAEDARTQQFFQRKRIESLCQAHVNHEQNHGYRLWNLLILEMWLRRWT